ncbi:MAG TPA: tetratricopeptide repeat protein [Pyrinomonadaceae bacterium]|nr:tetratricopeptide repeat protein [Pyrinomonadaceae bacterium]
MKKLIGFAILISLFSLQAFAQDIETLRNQIDVAATDSERIRLRLKLADLLLSTGHKTEAIAELNTIASSNVFDPVGFYNLGNAFARLGNNESAIAAYRNAIQQRNGHYSRALNNLGVILLRTGRWDEAHEALVSALQLENFRYAEASYNLGRVYSARGQNDLAAREWRRALAIDPKHEAAKEALANTGTEERIVVAASQPSKPVTKTAAVTKSPTVASATASPKSLQLDQTSFDFLQRARNASERGKMTEAVENFRRVLSREGGYFPPANLELSYALLSLKRYDEALTNLLEVTKRDGARYPISYFHLARLYERNGDLRLAEAAFAQVAPTNTQFLLDLSRVREKLGDYKGSLETMETYLKLMQDQGQKPAWSDQRLAELRTKAAKQ